MNSILSNKHLEPILENMALSECMEESDNKKIYDLTTFKIHYKISTCSKNGLFCLNKLK